MQSDPGNAEKRFLALIVDDDVELGELLREALAAHRIQVEVVSDARRGLARALSGEHDFLLLDVMLPALDGFELLRLVRRQSRVPVMMLTARTAANDQILGLNAGADDYLHKPFGVDLLLARIRALLRRTHRTPVEPDALIFGRVRILTGNREVFVDGAPFELTSSEYDVLEYLARAAGRVVPRSELTVALFQRHATRFDRTLDTHIYNLRKKLGSNAEMIGTVRGVGYIFRAIDSAAGQS